MRKINFEGGHQEKVFQAECGVTKENIPSGITEVESKKQRQCQHSKLSLTKVIKHIIIITFGAILMEIALNYFL